MSLPIFQTKIQELSLMQTSWASLLNPILKRFLPDSSSALGNAIQNEYVFNTANVTAAGGTNTSSFGYGAQGTPILAYNSTALGGATTFTCRFKNPINKDTDLIFMEVLPPNTSTWLEINYVAFGLSYANTAVYGCAVVGSTVATDVIVEFANSGINSNNCAYGTANGFPWSVVAAAPAWRWRLRKLSLG